MGRSCSSAAAAAAAEGRKEHWRRTHLVLELGRVAPVHGHGGAVHVQLADDAHAALRAADELGPEGALVGALAEAEEADEDVALRVFVREERLPAAVRGVVAPEELDGLRPDLVVDLMNLRRQ